MPAFSFRHIKDLYPVFWSKTREMIGAMTADFESTGNNVVETSDWVSRATLDIIGVAGLGRDFRALSDPSNELNMNYRRIFTSNKLARFLQLISSFVPVTLLRMLPLKRNEEILEALRVIKSTCRSLISSKKEKLASAKSRTDVDILSVALESGGFSDENLQNQLMTFLAAGHETTASTMSWAVYALAQYPDLQRRLRDEIRANLPSIMNESSPIDATMIDRLPYLNAVCNEILRLHPPVGLTLREAAHDTKLAGHFIPKGTLVVLPVWAINTDPELWGPDADEFNPDRWLKPGQANAGGAASNYAFMTFLHGPRSCIGQKFAHAEFACMLAGWAGKFEWEQAEKNYELDIQGGITMKPKDYKVKIKVLEEW
jgi:cytochrome P450